MMVQNYDSGLMTPMMPTLKPSPLDANAVGLMLLDYILLIVIPLFFMLGANIRNEPVYPGYVFDFPRPIHPVQRAYERDLHRALVLFWPAGLASAWFAIRQVCHDPKGDMMVMQLLPVFLGFCICFITYRISSLKIDSNEYLLLVDDDDLFSDRKEAANVESRGLGEIESV
ncbi:hypothetical protein CEP51_006746 [Fusarium floridanum]|uniref:Uncharacterized protein n=1 Tax=Fusarium floridanum TaxID=1325733 RepID=A0A428RRT7_9HYPO|nr:hypothetical protein CEP51_006746 [Fusarium floridanum]